jgi:hypothetical protein
VALLSVHDHQGSLIIEGVGRESPGKHAATSGTGANMDDNRASTRRGVHGVENWQRNVEVLGLRRKLEQLQRGFGRDQGY